MQTERFGSVGGFGLLKTEPNRKLVEYKNLTIYVDFEFDFSLYY